MKFAVKFKKIYLDFLVPTFQISLAPTKFALVAALVEILMWLGVYIACTMDSFRDSVSEFRLDCGPGFFRN